MIEAERPIGLGESSFARASIASDFFVGLAISLFSFLLDELSPALNHESEVVAGHSDKSDTKGNSVPLGYSALTFLLQLD